MAISITSLKNSTRNSKIFWMDIHFFNFTTWWARVFFCLFLFFVLVLDFTFKFIASVSSCPFLDYNRKKEVLSLITVQGNTVFLKPRMKWLGPQFFQQPKDIILVYHLWIHWFTILLPCYQCAFIWAIYTDNAYLIPKASVHTDKQ